MDEEHQQIARRLRMYGITPSGNKSADKAKLHEIELREAKKEGKGINALTVGSDDILHYYKKYFFCDGEFLNFGTPRYDTIINSNKEDSVSFLYWF